MNTQQPAISATEYIRQLEQLDPNAWNFQSPGGLLLEEDKTASTEGYAALFLKPLSHLRLFPFQSHDLYIELSCTSWDELEQLPHRIARSCVLSGGLYGNFYGGVVLDLRWCDGQPSSGQLATLERFLLNARNQLFPIILTAPGAGKAVMEQLNALALQQISTDLEPRKQQPKRLIGFEREVL